MFERLKSMSALKWKDIRKGVKTFHFHPIDDWEDTSEPNGFKGFPLEIRDFPTWQFKNFGECRFIGFFNADNIFELVWIDRYHKVYPHK